MNIALNHSTAEGFSRSNNNSQYPAIPSLSNMTSTVEQQQALNIMGLITQQQQHPFIYGQAIQNGQIPQSTMNRNDSHSTRSPSRSSDDSSDNSVNGALSPPPSANPDAVPQSSTAVVASAIQHQIAQQQQQELMRQQQAQQQQQQAQVQQQLQANSIQTSLHQVSSMGTLGAALQQATGIEPAAGGAGFHGFNNTDFFSSFSNNNLLSYPMRNELMGLSGIRHNAHMNFGFETKPDIHQMTMREPKPYKCPHCVKSFANNSYLSQHMRIHLGIKPFGPCQYCGKKFTQLSHLQQHIRTHTGEKPYKCKFSGCDKQFSQLSNLQSHSRCHQADKPFKCNSCYKCFVDEATLLEHIPKHKESKHLKVHICPFCGKSYTQALYLDKHMTKHSDRRTDFRFPKNYYTGDFSADGFDINNHIGNLNQLQNEEFALRQFQMAAAAAQQSSVLANVNTTSAPAATYSYPSATSAIANSNNVSAVANSMIGNNTLAQFNFLQRSFQRGFTENNRPAGFNMITPLENIKHFSQNAAAQTAAFNNCA